MKERIVYLRGVLTYSRNQFTEFKIKAFLRLGCLLFAASFFVINGFADGLNNWHWRNPLPSSANLNSVAFGNGLFVAVGDLGPVQISSDGTNWTTLPPFGPITLNKVIFTNSQFVAVGNSGAIL